MVDGEPQLEPVLALLPRRPVGAAAADAGVADQHVQRGDGLLDLGGEAPDVVQRGEIGLEGRRTAELRAQRVELLAAAPVQQHVRPRAARSRATPRPSPSVAPVMRTVVSSIGRMPRRLAIATVCEHMFVRWKDQETERDGQGRLPGYNEAVVRHFDAPEALDTRFYEVHAKSALNRVPRSRACRSRGRSTRIGDVRMPARSAGGRHSGPHGDGRTRELRHIRPGNRITARRSSGVIGDTRHEGARPLDGAKPACRVTLETGRS